MFLNSYPLVYITQELQDFNHIPVSTVHALLQHQLNIFLKPAIYIHIYTYKYRIPPGKGGAFGAKWSNKREHTEQNTERRRVKEKQKKGKTMRLV